MEQGKTAGDLLRFVGFAAICVGLAWVVQVIGSGEPADVARFAWVMAAAVVCGAGAGMVVASNTLVEPATVPVG